MHHFFTTESTAPPAISALWYRVIVLFVVTAIMMSLRYYQNEQFRKCFQYLQGFQLICLYLWYFAYHIPWSNSLPFYHCGLVFTRPMEKQTVLCLDGSEWSYLCLGLSSLWSLYFPSYYKLFFPPRTLLSPHQFLDLSLEMVWSKPLKK